ncbi:MAG: AbrB/MazE/SpoVT family DNA-binding domain-containing protein [Zavarzinella sp.]
MSEQPRIHHTKIGPARRIVLPTSWCQELQLQPGDPISLEFDEHGLHIRTLHDTIAEIQASLAPLKGSDSIVDQFIAEKRAAAAQEAEE